MDLCSFSKAEETLVVAGFQLQGVHPSASAAEIHRAVLGNRAHQASSEELAASHRLVRL